MRNPYLFLTVAFGVCLAGGLGHFFATGPKPAIAAATPFFNTPEKAAARPKIFPAADAPPATAAEKWRALLATDPADTDGLAAGLLDELCRAGKFQDACDLAREAPAELRPGLLKIIFSRWAQTRPQDAVKALATITDPAEQSVALRATASSWDVNDLDGLAKFAIALPAGDDRDYALGLALDNWSLQDPAALATWLNTLPHGDEFDYGATMMIARTDGANRTPELAVKWIENIATPSLKYISLLRVLSEWKQSDPTAAQAYVTNTPWLEPTQRQTALAYLSAPPPDNQ